MLVKVGADHAASTADYAAIPAEMQKVAQYFGKQRLCEVSANAFREQLPKLRHEVGERACMRAVHYWYENELVDKRWESLCSGNVEEFIRLTRQSAASSAMYLQNVSAELGDSQPTMYALALAEHILDGAGAVRIHGGGFGGTIQAFVPNELTENFIAQMNTWLGPDAARHYVISKQGACASWM